MISFDANAKELYDILKKMKHICSGNKGSSLYHNVKIKVVFGFYIYVEAGNYDTYMAAHLTSAYHVNDSTDTQFLVCKWEELYKVIEGFKGEDITISSINPSKFEVSVRDGAVAAKIQRLPDQTFEQFDILTGQPVLVNPAPFKSAVKLAQRFCKDGSAPELVHIDMNSANEVSVSATDGVRLCDTWLRTEGPNDAMLKNVSIPEWILPIIYDLGSDPLGIDIVDNYLILYQANTKTILSGISLPNKFGYVNRILNNNIVQFSSSILIDREEFSKAVKLCMEVNSTLNFRLHTTGANLDFVDISADLAHFGDMVYNLPGRSTGTNQEVSVNGRYISETLTAMKSKKVTMFFAGREKPVMILDENENSRVLIMPLKVKQ